MLAVAVHRVRQPLVAIAIALATVGLLAMVTGMRMHGDYTSSGLADCLSLGNRANCQPLIDRYANRFDSLTILILPLVLLPGLLGAFLGAPLVAREVEAGTHRFWWTQGVTRTRWFTTSSAVAIGVAALAGTAYAVIADRWLGVSNVVTDERFSRLYDLQGVVPIAACVFAVALGIACGVVLRQTLPAMVATLGVFIAVRIITASFLRPHFAGSQTLSVPYARTDPLAGTGAWEISNRTIDRTGVVLGRDGSLDLTGLGNRCPGISASPGAELPDSTIVERCLRDLNVRSVIRYQPGDRFWPFQIAESVVLIGLAGIALAVAARAVQRRPA